MQTATTIPPAAIHAARRRAGLAEWRANWPLVLAATAGMSITGVHLYSLGALMVPIAEETGWSRTQITLGQTFSSMLSSLLAPVCGVLVDRYGPRRIAIPGTIIFCLGLMAFATIGNSLFHWYAMWGVISLGLIGLKPNVWTGAVSVKFDASRALAFAVVISGVSLSAAFVPTIGTALAGRFGWRGAYVELGILWSLLLVPLIFVFPKARVPKRGERAEAKAPYPGLTVRQGLTSPAFVKLTVTGFLFTLGLFGLTFHFIPLLRDRGIDAPAAAGIAGLIGIFSIVGRLITGVLLDRYHGATIGGIALLLPIIPVVLLLTVHGRVVPLLMFFAILVGLSVGSEMDLLAYLSTKHFGLRCYGTLFGFVISVLAAATALGPLIVSAVRDSMGNYDPALWAMIPIFVLSAILIATTGRYPAFEPIA
jgi:predicted MFS family arabinose efflux permease